MYGQEKAISQEVDSYQRGAFLCAADGGKQRQREVPGQMQALEKALICFEESVRELLNRLDPIVRPAAPEPVGNSTTQLAVVSSSTSFGAEVQSYRDRANRMAERVQDVLRRLEI